MLQRKPSLSSSPLSPVAHPILCQRSPPVLNSGTTTQPFPLPPIRSRKRTDVQKHSLSPKVTE